MKQPDKQEAFDALLFYSEESFYQIQHMHRQSHNIY
jgi:hypothetical protein